MADIQALDPTAKWAHQSHRLQVFKVSECSPTPGNNMQASEGIMTSNCCVHHLDLWGEPDSWILAVQCSSCWLPWIDTKLGALKAPLISFLFKHKFNIILIWRETVHNRISQWYRFFIRAQLNFQFTAEPSLLPCPVHPLSSAGAVLWVQHQTCSTLGKVRSSSHSFGSRTEHSKGKQPHFPSLLAAGQWCRVSN